MESKTYTFKEISQYTGYKPSVIRYYEKEFKLEIARDKNGRRVFSQKDLDALLFIKDYQKKGFTNGQIKLKLIGREPIAMEEVATALDVQQSPVNIIPTLGNMDLNVLKSIEEKFHEINTNISELNQTVTGKERDIIISENLKLKMEVKQKTYELIELREKLRSEKDKNKGFLKKLFKKAR